MSLELDTSDLKLGITTSQLVSFEQVALLRLASLFCLP